MSLNFTELSVNTAESINWLSPIIGISAALFAIYIWFYDRKNMREVTLYFPLFMTCHGIMDVIKNYDTLGEDHSRNLFISSARNLDEIIYTHGSIIHLKRVDDLRNFFDLKKAIDENLEFINTRSWPALVEKFESDEFKKIESYSMALLKRCTEEVKIFEELQV